MKKEWAHFLPNFKEGLEAILDLASGEKLLVTLGNNFKNCNFCKRRI